MSNQALSPQELKAIMQSEGINNPVLATRVVGGRIELHLLGGAVILAPSPQQNEDANDQLPSPKLSSLTVDQLQQVAADLGMSGYSRLRKQQLIDALLDRFSPEELTEAYPSEAWDRS
ncbi:MAG: Rho termination factor N-terminal domain-containing protein [Chloroflexota bacterium]|jgi:hypothetical protein